MVLAEEVLRHVGAVVRVAEPYMDAVTAVSGSGPAYFALLAEAMIEAGILLGLSREISTQLVVQTMLGTAKQLRDLKMHPVELREMVTSPGGTTIAAIRELEQAGVRAAFLNAIQAAMDRSRELAAGDSADGVEIRVVDDPVGRLPTSSSAAAGHVALSGGSTPRPPYELAARDPAGLVRHPRLVRRRARRAAGRRALELPAGEGGAARPAECATGGAPGPRRAGAEQAADLYDAALEDITLDLALNGIGPDGHTASLFPGAPALDERGRRAVAAEPRLEPFVPRVTMTPPCSPRRRCSSTS